MFEEPLLTNFSIVLNDSQIKKVKAYLTDHNYLFRGVDYAHFGASSKTEKINLTLYKSGKCFIQGKGTGDFVRFYLEPEILKKVIVGYEDTLDDKNNVDRIGVDESGKGDYFGPLVIASVFVSKDQAQALRNMGVRDSKNIKDKTAEILAAKIKKMQPYSVVSIGPERYNDLYDKFKNLNRLLAWGHARAIENLLEKTDCKKAISDQFGNKKLIENALMKKGKEIELIQKTKAESDMAVAAASIVARAEFLFRLRKLGETHKTTLCKGASTKTQELGLEYAKEQGFENLNKVAKLHFRTTDVIKGKLPKNMIKSLAANQKEKPTVEEEEELNMSQGTELDNDSTQKPNPDSSHASD